MAKLEAANSPRSVGKPRLFTDDDIAAMASGQGNELPPPLQDKSLLGRVGNKVGQGMDALNEYAVEGGRVIDRVVHHPYDSLLNPVTAPPFRRQVERGIVHALPIPEAVSRGLIGDTAQADAATEPGAEKAGVGFGVLLPNPVSAFTGGVAGGLLSGIPAKGAVAGAALGAAKSVLGHELAVAPQAAASAALSGQDAGQAARDAATEPLGLGLAVGLGGIGGAGRGKAEAIRDPKTLSGRTLARIKAGGGEVRTLGSAPVRGGIYEDPELLSRPYGRAGVNEQADQAQLRILEENRRTLAKLRSDYGTQQDAILAKHAKASYDFRPLHGELALLEQGITASNGTTTDPALKAAIDQIRTATTSIPGALGRRPTASGTVSDLIKLQRAVKARANYGQPATVESGPYRILDEILAKEGEAIDPALGPLRQQYRQGIESLKDANDYLFGKREPDIADSAAKERAAALRLGRVGDETQAATGAADRQLEEFRKINPFYQKQVSLVEAKKNLERLRYGEPEVPQPIEKGMGMAAAGAAHHVSLGAIGYKLGGPLGAVLGAGAANYLKNPLATKLRLQLPVSDFVGNRVTGALAPKVENVLIRSAQDRKRKNEENARVLRGEAP